MLQDRMKKWLCFWESSRRCARRLIARRPTLSVRRSRESCSRTQKTRNGSKKCLDRGLMRRWLGQAILIRVWWIRTWWLWRKIWPNCSKNRVKSVNLRRLKSKDSCPRFARREARQLGWIGSKYWQASTVQIICRLRCNLRAAHKRCRDSKTEWGQISINAAELFFSLFLLQIYKINNFF